MSVSDQHALALRLDAVRDRIRLINTDVDKPSALKDGPDLFWATEELREVADRLRGKPCVRCGEFYGIGGHGPSSCIDRRARVAFTVGYAVGYDEALARATPEDPVMKVGVPGGGGWLWREADEAQAFLSSREFAAAFPGRDPTEFAVYRLELPTGWNVDASAEPDLKDGVYRLLNDAPILGRA